MGSVLLNSEGIILSLTEINCLVLHYTHSAAVLSFEQKQTLYEAASICLLSILIPMGTPKEVVSSRSQFTLVSLFF